MPAGESHGTSHEPTLLGSLRHAHEERNKARTDTVDDGRGSSLVRWVEAVGRCGNRRPRVERLVFAWDQGTSNDLKLAGEPDDPLVEASAKPKKRHRTRLTDEEVDAMRTARGASASVADLVRQFDVHRGTVWAKTRRSHA